MPITYSINDVNQSPYGTNLLQQGTVVPPEISINITADQELGGQFHYGINTQKIEKELIKQYKSDLLRVIINDEIESGEISDCERYILHHVNERNIKYIKEAANELYLEQYEDHPNVLIGLYLMMGTLSYDEAYPQGQTMAIGGLQHWDIDVRDRAIQMFERWNSKKGISVLKGLACDQVWLQKYVDEVLAYLERDGED